MGAAYLRHTSDWCSLSVDDVTFPSTPIVPGWGIALLVLVSVVVALVILYLLTLVSALSHP